MSRRRYKDAYTNALARWMLGKIKPAKPTAKPKPKARSNPVVHTTHRPRRRTQPQLTLLPPQTKPIKLRNYQAEALEVFLAKRKGTMTHATGLGKTITAIQIIKRLDVPTAIIVPTIAILEQVWLRFLRQAGYTNIGTFYGHRKQINPITVFTYQSAIRYPWKLKPFPFIIFDEIHHLGAPRYITLLPYAEKARYALGLTATLDKWSPRNAPILKAMPIIHRMPIGEARKEGWVSPIQVFSTPAEMTSQESIEYQEYTDIIRRVAWKLATSDPTKWSKLAKRGDPTARKGLWAIAKRRMLLSGIQDKLRVLLEIVKQHLDAKILLFSESIKSVENAKRVLLKNGIPCETYHSKKNKKLRRKILKMWQIGYFNLLLSVTALEEGLDVPACEVGILLASGRTPRKLTQRIGRIIRPAPGKVAKIYVINCPSTIEWKIVDGVRRAVRKVK